MNRFDQQLGYYNGMGGIGSSIKKALKKVGKGIKTGLSSINEKRLDIRHKSKEITAKVKPSFLKDAENKVREIGRDADRKGITKIAAAAVLSVVSFGAASPAVAAAIMAAKAYAVKKLGESGARDYQKVKTAEAQMEYEAEAAATLAQAVRDLPEFQLVLDELRAEGYTDAEIAAHWVESRAYYESALTAAADAVYPATLLETQQMGVPVEWQQPIAEQAALEIADTAVKQVKSEVQAAAQTPLQKLLPIALLVGLAVLGG